MDWRQWIERSLTWSAPQRRVVAALVGVLLLIIVWRAAVDSSVLPDPPPPVGARAHVVANRIDPNTADEAALVTLPGIGPARAQGIIAYREAFARRNPSRPAFRRAEDLLYVDGFGHSMVEQLREYLIFGDPPSGEIEGASGQK